jgi:riboflavin synthase
MFTGIVEALGKIEKIEKEQHNVHYWLSCPFTHELKIDQSLAHSGVCLTVVEIRDKHYKVTAIQETLDRTNLKSWTEGSLVNLERCMPAHGRFDGHIVQGHVDQTATCTKIEDQQGSWKYYFRYDPSLHNITVEKGSICVNGTSLTVVDSGDHFFSVCIIPYTYENTVFKTLKEGDEVNLEFDILGKYIAKMMKGRLG